MSKQAQAHKPKRAIVHKTSFLMRPRAFCGVLLRPGIKSAEAWGWVTCRRCNRARVIYMNMRHQTTKQEK